MNDLYSIYQSQKYFLHHSYWTFFFFHQQQHIWAIFIMFKPFGYFFSYLSEWSKTLLYFTLRFNCFCKWRSWISNNTSTTKSTRQTPYDPAFNQLPFLSQSIGNFLLIHFYLIYEKLLRTILRTFLFHCYYIEIQEMNFYFTPPEITRLPLNIPDD